jgi:hypothetical protein
VISHPRRVLFALALLALATSACRDPVFFPEFEVDTTDFDNHEANDAAIGKNGDFVVAWFESDTTEVFARAFSAITVPLGDPFPMNADTAPQRRRASMARDASGRYVIVWQEGEEEFIRGQRFDADGTPIGNNFTVSTSTQYAVLSPFVASDPSGNFVVTWTWDIPLSADVMARRFDSNGMALGDPFRVNQFTPGFQVASGIAMSATGFVVTWGGAAFVGDRPSGRLFEADGDPITSDFQLNSSTLNDDFFRPDVAMTAAGDFVVVWSDETNGPHWVRARRFARNGNPVGDDFVIRQHTTLSAFDPRVASDSFGNFLAVWEERPADDFLAPTDVFGRFHPMTGVGGSTFPISQITAASQTRARPSLADDGSFIVAFSSGDVPDFDVKGRKSGARAAPEIVMDSQSLTLAGGDTSGNGVFEPGETQVLQTAWVNDTAELVEGIIGQTDLFTGPLGPTYTINDDMATYDVLPTGQSKSCLDEADCFSVTVSDAIPRPAQHWDALFQEQTNMSVSHTWVLHLGESFPDVLTGHQFYKFIETLFHNKVTTGCAGGGYCPGNPVTRAQMAVFLLKGRFGSAHIPPPCTGTVFPDVPCTGGTFDPWIEELAGLGITGGCGGGLYCPNNTVTRQQMAVFLLKAFEGSAYLPPACAGIFNDVPCTPGTGFSDWIEELFNRGITGGCSVTPPLYCPTNPNNRGQMAVFLTKTFGLVLYGG